MESRDWHELVSQPMFKMKAMKDILVPMRDGVRLSIDIYAPDVTGKFPALLSLSPYGKDVQKLPICPGPNDFRLGTGGIESGDSEYFVSRGYVHVIADVRGTGCSEGGYRFFSIKEQVDGYDLVEWMASQSWCDGNVGMLGMSYFAMIQNLVAALNPPHLKAIFAHDAMTDIYRQWFYHGGILHYGFLSNWYPHVPVHTIDPLSLSATKLAQAVETAKADKDVQACPLAYITLGLPEKDMLLFDALIHPFDGPYYRERSAYTKFNRIKVPTYLLAHWSARAGHLPGAFSAFLGINSPKKLNVGVTKPGQNIGRPWRENHDIILRWYDHHLKGINTGIMDEPPINLFVQGENNWRFEHEWPLARTKWTRLYLRENSTLNEDPPTSREMPDSFVSIPRLLHGQKVPGVTYTTSPFCENKEITGPIAFYFYAILSSEDTDWMTEIHDIAPDGSKKLVSMGWLKASHRELDPSRSKPYQPFHLHLNRSPVVPGEITEYAMEIRETSYVFKASHRLQLTIKGQDAPWETTDGSREFSFHLTSCRQTEHSVYHTPEYQSYLLLPEIP